MPAVSSRKLQPLNRAKRYLVYPRTSDGPRWAYFAFIGLALIIMLAVLLFVNRKRGRRGENLVKGTKWMTPASFCSPENQYHLRNRQKLNLEREQRREHPQAAKFKQMRQNVDRRDQTHQSNTIIPVAPENIHPKVTEPKIGAKVQKLPNLKDDSFNSKSMVIPSGPPPSYTVSKLGNGDNN